MGSRWIYYNPNPRGRRTTDCTVRAISCALGQSWLATYDGTTAEGRWLADMPESNATWGAYLRAHGFRRRVIPESCGDDYTVEDFCLDHPWGVYLLAISGHVVCVRDGYYFDAWDSGNEIPVYYWYRVRRRHDAH